MMPMAKGAESHLHIILRPLQMEKIWQRYIGINHRSWNLPVRLVLKALLILCQVSEAANSRFITGVATSIKHHQLWQETLQQEMVIDKVFIHSIMRLTPWRHLRRWRAYPNIRRKCRLIATLRVSIESRLFYSMKKLSIPLQILTSVPTGYFLINKKVRNL